MVEAVFDIYVDAVPESGIVWWAETSAVPGLTVAADSLVELRRLITEATAAHLGSDVIVTLTLVDGATDVPATEIGTPVDDTAGTHSAAGRLRQSIVFPHEVALT